MSTFIVGALATASAKFSAEFIARRNA